MANRADPVSRPRSRTRVGPWLLGLGLAVLQTLWFVWFYREPLFNARNLGGIIPRWIFLARALPGVIPGVEFSQSYLGMALSELREFGNLPQRFPMLGAAGMIAAAAFGLGGLILRALGLSRVLSPGERLVMAWGPGASGLGVITLLAGRLGWLAPWPCRIGLGLLAATEAACLVVEFRSRAKAANDRPREPFGLGGWVGFGLVAGPFLMMMTLGALLPTIDFDAIEYHLQGPKEYYQAGRIAFLPHNVYTSMPFSVEMLHLLGMEVLNDWWRGALAGQLLIALHAPLAAAMVGLTARRLGSPRAAWFAPVVYLTTPWVYRLGVLPYVEGPLCFYHAALVWSTLRVWSEPDPGTRRKFWAATGLLAGGAFACKYPALVSAVVPFGVAALADSVRRRSLSALLAFVLGASALATPWLVKNLTDTGNPVYPLGYQVFGGTHWDNAKDAKWANAHGPRPVSAALLEASMIDVAGRSDWQSPLFAVLAPLALLRPGSRRAAAWLWVYVAYLFLTWWFLTHRLDRFWLPLLPASAVLAGLGADWTRRIAWSAWLALLLTLATVANLAYASTALTGLNEWTRDLRALRTSVPLLVNGPLARTDNTLPPGAKLLLVGQAAVFHVNHPVVYNTVFNDETFETLARDRSPWEVATALDRLGVTHIYVDWHEIERYRSPGNYGFTPFVTPEQFDRLVKAGVLDPAEPAGPGQELFRVRSRAIGCRPG